MKSYKREWPMPITPAERAAGLRYIAKTGNLWPEAIAELHEAANLLETMQEVQP